MKSSFRYCALALLFAGLASIPLFVRVPNPYNNLLLNELHDCGHSFLFFLFHLLLLFLVRHLAIRFTRSEPIALILLGTSAISFAVGGLIELIQPFVHRDSSWGDVGRNTLGIIAANGAFIAALPGIHSFWQKLAGAFVATGTLLLSLTPAAPWAYAQILRDQSFPLLMDYETPTLRKYLNAAAGARVHVVPAPAAWHENQSWVAQVTLPQGARYPGMQIRNPTPNWQHFHTLSFDAYSPNRRTEIIAVNIYSVEKRRIPFVHHKFAIEPGSHHYNLTLPEPDVLENNHISDVLWHAMTTEHSATLYLDNIVLH